MITAVLLKWKRIAELEKIISQLKNIPRISEIIVRDPGEPDLCCYGRYVSAQDASNNLIYVQDDDCIVDNIDELVDEFDGENIISNLKPSHINEYGMLDTLVGWGCIFDKRWVSCMDRYIDKYGIDKVLQREADRVFTGLHGKIKTIVNNNIIDFPSANGDMAMFRQDNHIELREKARRRVDELGRG